MIKTLFICLFPYFVFGQNMKGPPEFNEPTSKQKTKLISKIFLSDNIHIVVKRTGCINLNVFYDYTLIKKGNNYIGTFIQTVNGKIEYQQVLKIEKSTLSSFQELFHKEIKIDEGSSSSKTKFTLSSTINSVTFNDDRSETYDILQKLKKIICGRYID